MAGELRRLGLIGTLFLSCVHLGSNTGSPDLVISKLERSIDISTQIVKVMDVITLENSGKSAAKSFLVAIDPSLSKHLAFIGAVTKGKKQSEDDEEDSGKLTVHKASTQRDMMFQVDLPQVLQAGSSVTVEVEHVYAHVLDPYPSHISQAEKQLVVFNSNHYVYSPYRTKSQKTVVTLSSSNVESYSKLKPTSQTDKTVTYGPYENIPEFSQDKMVIHYENNSPFLTVTNLERLIEVSHWGNIAVEESIDIMHSGALLKGSFSRYDFQRDQNSGVSSVKSYKTILPAAAADVYYRDEIGNISTSHLREYDDYVEVELRPRFPLFGGWKTRYVLGYNIPSYEYLYNSGDHYVLKMRFVDHVHDDSVVDQVKVRIILPEGAKNIKLRAPYDVHGTTYDDLHFTYLDTVGRPVIVTHKSNLVEQHIQDFEIHYTFKKMLLLQEPLLVVGAFYLLFTLVIIYVRLDFSISKDAQSESRMRVSGFVEQVQSIQDRRSAVYQSYDDAISKYKQSKDNGKFQSDRKKIDADYKQLSQTIGDLQGKLKQEGSDTSEKVSELQRKDRDLKENLNQAIQSVEKLINGKMNKGQYVTMEKAYNEKREEILSQMEKILSTL